MPTFDPADADRGTATHQFHQSFAAVGIPTDGLQTFVMAQEIAPGVHFLAGGSHNSLVIEQENGVVVAEAPLYEYRSDALLTWIEDNIGKPVTHVIATHHHDDHTGGLRAFAAEGAEIVIGADSAAYFQGHVFSAPSTIIPDALAMNPVPVTLHAVPALGSYTIDDPALPVVAQAIQSTHAKDMLLIHVPDAEVVFVSDIYSPGNPPNPFGAAEVYAGIVDNNLSVTTLAGGHGGVGTFQALEDIVMP